MTLGERIVAHEQRRLGEALKPVMER